MKSSELRDLEVDELKAQLLESERAFFKLRTRREVEQITDKSGITKMRRDIARLKTEIRFRELSQSPEGSKAT